MAKLCKKCGAELDQLTGKCPACGTEKQSASPKKRSRAALWAAVCLLLAVVGVGVYFFVYGGTINGSMEKLLEEGDYTRSEKSRKNITGPVSVIYWLAVTAVFLIDTFGPNGNGQPGYSWIIWAVAGVLYAAVLAVVKLIRSRK